MLKESGSEISVNESIHSRIRVFRNPSEKPHKSLQSKVDAVGLVPLLTL